MGEKPISFSESSKTDDATSIPEYPTLPSSTVENDLRSNSTYSYNKGENDYSSDQNTPRKSNSSLSVDFETSDLYKFVEDHGMQVIWERSYLCTCRDPDTGKPDINCPICGGTGRAYLPGVSIKMMIQSQNRKETYNNMGVYQKGDALGTTQMETPVATRDRITCPDIHVIQAFIFNAKQNIMDKGIRLPYRVYKFLYVGYSKKQLKQDIDFSYDTKNQLFKVLNKDLLNQNISIRFDMTLRYIITNIDKENRYQYSSRGILDKHIRYEALPKLCELTREQSIIGETTKSLASSSDILNNLNESLNEVTGNNTMGSIPDISKEGFHI